MIVWDPNKTIDIGELSIGGDGPLEKFYCNWILLLWLLGQERDLSSKVISGHGAGCLWLPTGAVLLRCQGCALLQVSAHPGLELLPRCKTPTTNQTNCPACSLSSRPTHIWYEIKFDLLFYAIATVFQLNHSSDVIYAMRRRKPKPTLLPTRGIFNFRYHVGVVWEKLVFDDAVSYTQQENGLLHC